MELTEQRMNQTHQLDQLAEEIASGKKDPYTVCEEIMAGGLLA
jgi:hypothetical protein